MDRLNMRLMVWVPSWPVICIAFDSDDLKFHLVDELVKGWKVDWSCGNLLKLGQFAVGETSFNNHLWLLGVVLRQVHRVIHLDCPAELVAFLVKLLAATFSKSDWVLKVLNYRSPDCIVSLEHLSLLGVDTLSEFWEGARYDTFSLRVFFDHLTFFGL